MKSLEPESDEEDHELDDILDNLKENIKTCQKLGKYVEAQMTQNRIVELKEKKVQMKLSKLHIAQEKGLKLFQEAHEKENAALNAKWLQKIEELDAKADAEKDSFIKRHMQELEMCRKDVEGKVPEKSHPSQEIVALKKMEEALAKQGK